MPHPQVPPCTFQASQGRKHLKDRHSSEILHVWFQTMAMNWVSQESES